MAQMVSTTPLVSKNKSSPRQAKLPTALLGRSTPPPIQTAYVEVVKQIHGLSAFSATDAAHIFDPLFLQSATGEYPTYPTVLAFMQKAYSLYSSQDVLFTDGRSQHSDIAGGGECPVTSGSFPNANWGENLCDLNGSAQEPKSDVCDVDGDTGAHYGAGTSRLAGAVSLQAAWNMIEANIGQTFPAFNNSINPSVVGVSFNEPPTAGRNTNVSSLVPAAYDMSTRIFSGVTGIPSGPNQLPNAISNGVGIGGPNFPGPFMRWRGRLLLPASVWATPYFVGRMRFASTRGSGFSISGAPRAQAFAQFDVIDQGIMKPGQLMGWVLPGDSAAGIISIPEPAAPSFFDTIGPDNNPVIFDAYFGVLGTTPSGWGTPLGFVVGTNISIL